MGETTTSSGFNALEAARSISDTLRAHTDYGEKEGRPSPQTLEALKSSGMLSLWRPKSLGGHEVDPLSYAQAAEEVAHADTTAAWMMHASSAVWFDLRLGSAQLIEEIKASAEVPILGETFNRPMQATAVDGGYKITGEVPFASGSVFADWTGHTALCGEKFLLMFHPQGALQIKNDWDSLGMRGTASNSIVANELFVPAHRVIDFSAPVPAPTHDGALFRMPEGTIPVAVIATAMGCFKSALDATTGIAQNKVPFATMKTLKHKPLAQYNYARALALYRSARSYLHGALSEAYAVAERGDKYTLEQKADLGLAFTHALQTCDEGVRLIAKTVATTSAYKNNPIERAVRDMSVMVHHGFGAEGRFMSAAQAYWGVELDFPLLAMD